MTDAEVKELADFFSLLLIGGMAFAFVAAIVYAIAVEMAVKESRKRQAQYIADAHRIMDESLDRIYARRDRRTTDEGGRDA